MKHKWLMALALVASGIGAAQAHSNLAISIGVPLGGYYYAPPPPPPPVIYRERVYYEPVPVYQPYYAPRPVYYVPRGADVRYQHDRRDYDRGPGRGYDRRDDRWDDRRNDRRY